MKTTYIQLSTVLDEMNRLDSNNLPIPFQMKFVTADRIRRSGGEIIEVAGARKCVGFRSGKIVFDTRESSSPNQANGKDPHHWANATRNIILQNRRIRTVHIRLIIEFNNQKVCF